MRFVKGPFKGLTPFLDPVLRLTLVALLVHVPNALAENTARCDNPIATVTSVQGTVEIRRSERDAWQAAQLNQALCSGVEVRTQALSRAQILLRQDDAEGPNETHFQLDEHSALALPKPDKTSWLDLLRGAAHFLSRTPTTLTIRTLFANAKVEGTEFLVRVAPAQTSVSVFEGKILVSNALGSVHLVNGEAAVAEANRAPRREILVKPRDAVQWALYYPPLIDARLAAAGPNAEALREALRLYQSGQIMQAVGRLDKIDPKRRDSAYHALRAGLLLSVGRVELARGNIAAARKLNPEDGTALALESIIAITQNDKNQALRLTQQAIIAEPNSSVPHVARSYAEQASFNLDKALDSARTATRLAPDNALAWARVAELELAQGDTDEAEEAAEKSRTLDPQLARTQTIAGFAALTRIEISKATSSFTKAIARDPADPLPRLGLGLAKIRRGQLEEGRRDIEVAANLDPNNALVRSYLGKAYYEEKRSDVVGVELDNAKLLDPKDPTPWFYDAIRKQTENRPVEALHDLQKSIALNDNRAVYRSNLLLDGDRAVRGTSLARTFDDLGFEQRGLVEATKSLSLNPADYSAHRFLSDTYARLPRREIAQVSELLQAQLLQPINIQPVQPRLSIKGLSTVAGVGPAEAAFKDFTYVFERNRPQLTASGIVGNNDTYADEAVLSGIQGRFSYSLGQFHFETDGFREQADVTHDVYDAFAQAALTDKVNVQFEYRRRETDQGDLRLNFDPGFIPQERRTLDHDIARTGLHISISPRSDLIASLIYSDRQETSKTEQINVDRTEEKDRRRGYEGEGQYLIRWDNGDLAVGGGAYGLTGENVVTTVSTDPDLCTFSPEACEPSTTGPQAHDFHGHNVYAYTNTKFPAAVTWTFGLSNDAYESALHQVDLDEIHPKLGLQWDITERLRLRAAFFRTLKRLLAVDQTIEPTQVAGFNQFYDDPNGSRADVYGAALDSVFAKNIYAGFEFIRRELVRPEVGPKSKPKFRDQAEDQYRAYFYWAPHPRWAFNAEYQKERHYGEVLDLETDRVPITLRYFHPTGFFAQAGSTFVWQEKEGDNSLSDEFVVVDAALVL